MKLLLRIPFRVPYLLLLLLVSLLHRRRKERFSRLSLFRISRVSFLRDEKRERERERRESLTLPSLLFNFSPPPERQWNAVKSFFFLLLLTFPLFLFLSTLLSIFSWWVIGKFTQQSKESGGRKRGGGERTEGKVQRWLPGVEMWI